MKAHHPAERRDLSHSVLLSHSAENHGSDVEFRVIPTGKKVDQAAARAIALDQVWRNPLGLHCPPIA